MKDWEAFEVNCTDYLNKNLNYRNINFVRSGGSDSNSSDIYVFHENKKILTIECKLSPSQSSQFVVLIDSEKNRFIFSQKNKSMSSDASNILSHMNDKFKYYSQVDSNGKVYNKLICDNELKVDYIKRNIAQKSSLIISSNYKEDFSSKRPLFVCKISELDRYFEIEGTYRGKYSGSSTANEKKIKDFPLDTELIEGRYYHYDPKNNSPNYPTGDRSFYLSKEGKFKGFREVRIPSNTLNSNVIFTLKLKNESHSDLSLLRSKIDQNMSS